MKKHYLKELQSENERMKVLLSENGISTLLHRIELLECKNSNLHIDIIKLKLTIERLQRKIDLIKDICQ